MTSPVFVAPYGRYCSHLARHHARLGQTDLAIAELGMAYEQRHHLLPFLTMDPAFDALRRDARFRRIVQLVHPGARLAMK